MILRVISDYGSQVRVVTGNATADDVQATMQSIDWSFFHQVILARPNGDWIEAGGCMNPEEGLSLMYEENGLQLVIDDPPESVEEMTSVLLQYVTGNEQWREGRNWS